MCFVILPPFVVLKERKEILELVAQSKFDIEKYTTLYIQAQCV